MFFFGIPKVGSRGHLRDNRSGIDMGGGELVDELSGCILLCFREIKYSRPIGGPNVITLAIAGGRIVYLEKEFQQLPVGGFGRVEFNKNGFGMRAMIPICGIWNLSTRVPNVGLKDTRLAADQFLYAPEATAGKNSFFCIHNVCIIFILREACQELL